MDQVNIHDIPFADRFKGDKIYQPLDDEALAPPNRPTFTGDEEHILIHDINKAFANETKRKFDIAKLRIEAGTLLIKARQNVP